MSVPKLRFSGFAEKWNKKRLDSFLERVSNPVDVIKEQEYTQIGIRSHGKGIFHKEPINGLGLGNKRVFWVEPNAFVVNIVFAWERAIAVTTEAEKGMIASHRFPMYLPKNNLSNVHFLRYLFVTDKGQSYLELASPGGAGRNKTLGQSNFAELKIDLPSLEEQTKIASFLSAVDEKISQFTQKHELLSQYKQGMVQKLFSQQIRFKADDGSEFGEWDQSELKEVAQINPKVEKLPEKFIYIDLESVEKGLLLLEKNITLSEAPSRAQRLLSKGDVLFQMVRPYQQNNYYFNLDGQYVASTGYAQIRTELNSKFIYYALHEKSFLDEVMNRCTGTSYPAINSSDLSTIEIGIPCLEEQTKIANFLSAIDQKIEVVAQQIEQAKQWKKGLLQQMFV